MRHVMHLRTATPARMLAATAAGFVAVLAVLALQLRSDQSAQASGSTASSPAPSVPERPIMLPVFNQKGLESLLSGIKPMLRPGDTVVIVAGNNGNRLDIEWLNSSAARVRAALPGVNVYAMTAGLANVRAIRHAASHDITGIVYDYEPNFPNEPEFSWDFGVTTRNVREFGDLLSDTRFESVLLPTGQPLMRTRLDKYSWDYAALAALVDRVIVQTQLYCKAGDLAPAADRLSSQFASRSSDRPWGFQVTVDPMSPNGVTPTAAADCAAVASHAGGDGVMIWWSPWHEKETKDYLRLIGR